MKKHPSNKKAFTLIEVIVATAIFMVFISAVLGLYIHAIRKYRFLESRTGAKGHLDDARIGMDRMSKDLKKARFILYPDETVLRGQGSSIIIFSSLETRQVGATSTSIFGLRHNENTIEFLMLDSNYNLDPEDPGTTMSAIMSQVIYRRVIARNIQSLGFYQDDGQKPQLITIRLQTLQIKGDQVTLMTKIFIRH